MNPFGVNSDGIGELNSGPGVSAAVDANSEAPSCGLSPVAFKRKSHMAINVAWPGSEGVGIRLAQEAGIDGILVHFID